MSEPMKVWSVDVELTVSVPVVARTREEAIQVALDSYEEEIDNGTEPDVSAGGAYQISVAGELAGVLPYGVKDSDPRRDWPIDKWLAEANSGE